MATISIFVCWTHLSPFILCYAVKAGATVRFRGFWESGTTLTSHLRKATVRSFVDFSLPNSHGLRRWISGINPCILVFFFSHLPCPLPCRSFLARLFSTFLDTFYPHYNHKMSQGDGLPTYCVAVSRIHHFIRLTANLAVFRRATAIVTPIEIPRCHLMVARRTSAETPPTHLRTTR